MSQSKPSAKEAEKSGPDLLLHDADAVHRKRSEEFMHTDTERGTSAEGGGHRAYSPSSVSSATSTRPLEWDSGADVGYLLQNEERQLANAIKKLGLSLPSGSRSEIEIRSSNQKITVDSLREGGLASAPLSESTPKLVEGLMKGSGSLAGSRQTLLKTASSSSVATVVSKEADGSRTTDLITDLTQGLQLVKSLIAETRGDKEKQSRLLAHVVQQLKSVEDSKQKTRRRARNQRQESTTSSTAADTSSNSAGAFVTKIKQPSTHAQLSASGDSASSAVDISVKSEVAEDAYRKLLSGMSNQDNEQLLVWANSQERLNNYPPDPQLSKALECNDLEFANFLQSYINKECQRQACWRSDILNVMSKRAEIVRQKNEAETSKNISSRSTTSQSSLNSEKIQPNPSSALFPFNLQPSAKRRPTAKKQLHLENQTQAKIFQHIIDPPKVVPPKSIPQKEIPPQQASTSQQVPKAESERVPSSLDAFLANPDALKLFPPAVIEKVKKKLKTPTKGTKRSPPKKSNDCDLPLQELLQKMRPNFIKKAESRRKCLALLGERREQRGQMRRQCLKEQLDMYSGTLPEHVVLDHLPPPPLAEYRLFTQQQMREQTEKKYKNLAEIQKKEELKKKEEEHKTNRLMAQIFKRKLQNRVLHHKVDLSNSMSVITGD